MKYFGCHFHVTEMCDDLPVPPQWTMEPADTNVAAGQDATLHCQASGYPTPIVTWKKAIGKHHLGPFASPQVSGANGH